MGKGQYKRTIKILRMIAVGTLIIGIGGAPSTRAIGELLRALARGNTRESRRYAQRKIKQLKQRGFLERHGVRYAVTEKARRLLVREEITNLHIPTLPRWPHKWYFILFDIPQAESDARKALNRVLLGMGMIQYQQSILIYPFPIKDTVLPVCDFYKVTRYVSFITADHVDGERDLKIHFKL